MEPLPHKQLVPELGLVTIGIVLSSDYLQLQSFMLQAIIPKPNDRMIDGKG